MKHILKATSLAMLLSLGIAAQNAAGDSAVDYLNRGSDKFKKGDLDGALADYNHAIKVDPKFGPAYGARATVKAYKGDLDGAIADLNRNIELDPKDATAYFGRSKMKKAKGDLAGANADLKRASELNPSLAPGSQ